jgi:hypothetical protein
VGESAAAGRLSSPIQSYGRSQLPPTPSIPSLRVVGAAPAWNVAIWAVHLSFALMEPVAAIVCVVETICDSLRSATG